MGLIVSQYFNNIVTGPNKNINLAEVFLHIAFDDYPGLETAIYLIQLEDNQNHRADLNRGRHD